MSVSNFWHFYYQGFYEYDQNKHSYCQKFLVLGLKFSQEINFYSKIMFF